MVSTEVTVNIPKMKATEVHLKQWKRRQKGFGETVTETHWYNQLNRREKRQFEKRRFRSSTLSQYQNNCRERREKHQILQWDRLVLSCPLHLILVAFISFISLPEAVHAVTDCGNIKIGDLVVWVTIIIFCQLRFDNVFQADAVKRRYFLEKSIENVLPRDILRHSMQTHKICRGNL